MNSQSLVIIYDAVGTQVAVANAIRAYNVLHARVLGRVIRKYLIDAPLTRIRDIVNNALLVHARAIGQRCADRRLDVARARCGHANGRATGPLALPHASSLVVLEWFGLVDGREDVANCCARAGRVGRKHLRKGPVELVLL